MRKVHGCIITGTILTFFHWVGRCIILENKQTKIKHQEKGWASILSHLCRLIDKSVLAESLWASWVGWLCTSPPFFRDVYVQIRRWESLTCWAGVFCQSSPGDSVLHEHPLSQVALPGAFTAHVPSLGPALGAWWSLGDCETEGLRIVRLVEGGGLVKLDYLEPTFQGQKGKCHPQTAAWGCWLWDASAGHRELASHLS